MPNDTTPPARRRSAKTYIPEVLRRTVYERDNYTCQHCGSRQSLSIDHIHPESKGGPTTVDNCQTLCHHCNSRKGIKPLREWVAQEKAARAATVAFLDREVQALGQEIAEVEARLPEYGPRDPGPPVVLRREVYPTEDTSAVVVQSEDSGGFWARVVAWWEGRG